MYSLKKEEISDMVLNIIASEQNLAQEKVALSLQLLHPNIPRRQFHLSYELVVLPDFRMSTRRARYVLADELYEKLKQAVGKTMEGRSMDPSIIEATVHEVSTAAMKYALVSVSCSSKITFKLDKVISFEDSSAPFLLYNGTRLRSIFRKFEEGVEEGKYSPLPPIEQVNWNLLQDENEWDLFFEYILSFPSTVLFVACPPIPDPPQLPEFPVHLVFIFYLVSFSNENFRSVIF